MHDARLVRLLEATRDLHGDVERHRDGNWPAPQPRLQRFPVVVGHRDEQLPVGGGVDVIDRANVRMIKRRGGFSFLHEAVACVIVARQVGSDELEDNGTFEVGVLSRINHTHPAAGEATGNAVVRDDTAVHRSVGQAASSYSRGCFADP